MMPFTVVRLYILHHQRWGVDVPHRLMRQFEFKSYWNVCKINE